MLSTECLFKNNEINNIVYGMSQPSIREVEKNIPSIIHRCLIFSLCFLYCMSIYKKHGFNSADNKSNDECFSKLFKTLKINYDLAIYILTDIFLGNHENKDLYLNCDVDDDVFNDIHNIMINSYDGKQIKDKILLENTLSALLRILKFIDLIDIKLIKNRNNIKTINNDKLDVFDVVFIFDGEEYPMYEVLRKFDDRYYFLFDCIDDYFHYHELSGEEGDILQVNRFIWERR